MEPLTDAVGLMAFDLGFGVLNLIELQVQFIRMFVQAAAELGSTVR